jgi:hypothetical protein
MRGSSVGVPVGILLAFLTGHYSWLLAGGVAAGLALVYWCGASDARDP